MRPQLETLILVLVITLGGLLNTWGCHREFPGGPVVKTQCFHCVSLGSTPGQGPRSCKPCKIN